MLSQYIVVLAIPEQTWSISRCSHLGQLPAISGRAAAERAPAPPHMAGSSWYTDTKEHTIREIAGVVHCVCVVYHVIHRHMRTPHQRDCNVCAWCICCVHMHVCVYVLYACACARARVHLWCRTCGASILWSWGCIHIASTRSSASRHSTELHMPAILPHRPSADGTNAAASVRSLSRALHTCSFPGPLGKQHCYYESSWLAGSLRTGSGTSMKTQMINKNVPSTNWSRTSERKRPGQQRGMMWKRV